MVMTYGILSGLLDTGCRGNPRDEPGYFGERNTALFYVYMQ